jgi:hypothetical protein
MVSNERAILKRYAEELGVAKINLNNNLLY